MAISKIEEIIEDFRQGKMVILMDDEDRENEGDILMAASMVRPDDINFMASPVVTWVTKFIRMKSEKNRRNWELLKVYR
jgi:3,4-dihydroxy-2-butanone 4-phosphate synthase